LEQSIASLGGAEGNLRSDGRRVDLLSANLADIEMQQTAWKANGAVRLKEIEKALAGEHYAAEAREELTRIDAELKEIGYDAAQHDAVREQELAGRSAEAELRALQSAQAASQPLEREIADLEKQLDAQETEISLIEQAHTAAAAELAAAQAGLPDVQAAEREMLALQEKENKARQEVGAAQQLVAVLEDLRLRKQDLHKKREVYTKDIGQLQALERAFGKDGVPAMLIEQALPQIEIRANELLERLSGGGMYIRFVTQRQFKDSKRDDLRETLEIQIHDGAGERDYEMFSGGEAFRINFAIRLALSEVLAQRAGARLQTLVIDEGFGSQDEAGRQRLVEAINLVRDDFEKILVITHIDALKDAFPARIEVEKGPRGSTLQVL
jgi:exonuclease SbcC